MGPAIDSRIKPPDAGIPMLHTESKVEALNATHQLSNVMCGVSYYLTLSMVFPTFNMRQ
jgi:hypothetical protein